MNSQSTPALARIRTDVVGSLLRPMAVREGRVALDEGAMTAAAYVKEIQGAEMTWDKTEKTGAVGEIA